MRHANLKQHDSGDVFIIEEVEKNDDLLHAGPYKKCLMAWKNRQEFCQVAVLEVPEDPLFFREEVGRVKLFFSHFQILKLDRGH